MSDEAKIKLDRCGYFEREWISRIDKKTIALKTDGKCAICGKRIQVGDDEFTVDHFIPLSKGGSNDIKNLIPLCKKCNKEKDDNVMALHKALPFLKGKHKHELMELTARFVGEYTWLSSTNILMFDDETVTVLIPLPHRKGVRKGKSIKAPKNWRIKKEYEITDEMLKFIQDYNIAYNLDPNIKDMADGLAANGMLYTVRNTNDDSIVFLFYFDIKDVEPDGEDEMFSTYDNKPSKMIIISNIICQVPKTRLTEGLRAVLIEFVIRDIIASAESLGIKIMDFGITVNYGEQNLRELFKMLEEIMGVSDEIEAGLQEGLEESEFGVHSWTFVNPELRNLSKEELVAQAKKDRKILKDKLENRR